MGIFLLLQQYGPARVIAGLLAVKAVKANVVYWRSVHVNGKVDAALKEKLKIDEDDEANEKLDETSKSCSSKDICPLCECPLWLLQDTPEPNVQLSECGCLLHLRCFLDLGHRQHGIGLPSYSLPQSMEDFDELYDAAYASIGRFFGLLSVEAESLKCPRHRRPCTDWRQRGVSELALSELLGDSSKGINESEGGCRSSSTHRAKGDTVVAGLRSGRSMSMSDLMQAFKPLAGTDLSEKDLSDWDRAIQEQDEGALLRLLKEAGAGGSDELISALERCLRRCDDGAATTTSRTIELYRRPGEEPPAGRLEEPGEPPEVVREKHAAFIFG
mmetsp:Transcript_63771/g.138686  ORF Transcript_63771/g.138686 Transcript_63771/m.138686 type:complete len:329 (-) Transcript_63771:140-1126(-)|eukprot:CAMPEP_0206477890 /NCGR_PEP_ID=MMETSP0324_2-20121206/35707_1 /ASSEMBLY_ACC=CAM_ASM_000836 /TAXON_ID=2866 /ORGANISM="Crypthecodinium cohnii, Strain Seligo" /LENGTH=328 /DNA_ID=CAMNT_0053954051 /DNA_START=244 /DNA_END=1230 /DNA_ORIENTATION=+